MQVTITKDNVATEAEIYNTHNTELSVVTLTVPKQTIKFVAAATLAPGSSYMCKCFHDTCETNDAD